MSTLFHGEPGTHCLGIQRHFLESAHVGTRTHTHTHTHTHAFSNLRLHTHTHTHTHTHAFSNLLHTHTHTHTHTVFSNLRLQCPYNVWLRLQSSGG